jgi:hypothetical protein
MIDLSRSRSCGAILGKFSAALCLIALTCILFGVVDRFDTVVTKIVPNLSFEDGVKYWSGSPKGISLKNKPLPVIQMRLAPNPKPLLLARVIPIPDRFTHIRVGADVKIDGVQPGPVWWEQAGIIVRSLDKKWRKIPFWPYEVVLKSGTVDWRRHEAVIPVSSDAQEMRLLVFLDGRAGTMEVTNITIDSAVPSPWVFYAKAGLIAAWVILGLWILAPLLLANSRNILAYFALAAFLATLAAVLAPQPELSHVTNRTLNAALSLFKGDPKPYIPQNQDQAAKAKSLKKSKPVKSAATRRPSASKLGAMAASPRHIANGDGSAISHIISHAAFAFFTVLAFPLAGHLLLLSSLVTAAATTEALQVFVISRTTNWDDFTMNLIGVALGIAFALALRFIHRRLFARANQL